MARKFFFRGFELEQLTKMTMEDFIKLLPSKQRRTMKRMSSQIKKFIEKFRHHSRRNKDKPMKTHFRQMIVLPEMAGARMQVHSGNAFADFIVVPEMIGHRLGEFAHTCKLVKHSGPGIGATRGSKSVELK